MSLVTVTVPPAGAALTTRAAVKAALGIATVDTSADARIDTLISQVSAAIARYLCRTMGRYTATETFPLSFPGLRTLVLSDGPAVVSGVSVDGSALSGTDYNAIQTAGMVERANYLRWMGCVVVTYSAGWYLPGDPQRDLPEDIEAVAIGAVAAAYHADGRDMSVRSESVEGTGEVQFFAPATSGVLGAPGAAATFPALDAYRLRP